MEKSVEELEKEITCVICHDHYTEPKMLPCCHCYCKDCIHKLALRKGIDKPFSCPNCRTDTTLPQGGVASLKPAFFINRLVEIYSKLLSHDKVEVRCENCSGEKAEAFCRQCTMFICGECVRLHCTLKAFAGHKTVSLKELKEGKDMAEEAAFQTCPEHEELMEIYCFDCCRLICRPCTIRDHIGHNHEFIKKAVSRKMNPRKEGGDVVAATDRKAMEELRDRNTALQEQIREFSQTSALGKKQAEELTQKLEEVTLERDTLKSNRGRVQAMFETRARSQQGGDVVAATDRKAMEELRDRNTALQEQIREYSQTSALGKKQAEELTLKLEEVTLERDTLKSNQGRVQAMFETRARRQQGGDRKAMEELRDRNTALQEQIREYSQTSALGKKQAAQKLEEVTLERDTLKSNQGRVQETRARRQQGGDDVAAADRKARDRNTVLHEQIRKYSQTNAQQAEELTQKLEEVTLERDTLKSNQGRVQAMFETRARRQQGGDDGAAAAVEELRDRNTALQEQIREYSQTILEQRTVCAPTTPRTATIESSDVVVVTKCPLCYIPIGSKDELQLHYLTSCSGYDKVSNEHPRSKVSNYHQEGSEPAAPPAEPGGLGGVRGLDGGGRDLKGVEPQFPGAASTSATAEDGTPVAKDTQSDCSVQFMWQSTTNITYPCVTLLASFPRGSVDLSQDPEGGHYASKFVNIARGSYEGQLVIGESFVHPIKEFKVSKDDDIIVIQFEFSKGVVTQ